MKIQRLFRGFFFVFLPILCFAFSCLFAKAARSEEMVRWKHQAVYVPIYSHIYTGDREYQFALAATLSIRNTDPVHSMLITAVDYYDTDGRLLKHHLDSPGKLGPLVSARYVIQESDMSGGSGAKFIVKWKSEAFITPPIIEGVMIGTRGNQGISFLSRGQVIDGEKQ